MRLRIIFSKQGALRYTGHLDLHRIWERTARRVGLPLAYSQGFHPQPKIQLASALPLGFSSRAEVIDLWLTESISISGLNGQIEQNAPSGLKIVDLQSVDERSPALQTLLDSAAYQVTLLDEMPAALLDEKLTAIIAAESIRRVRRKKEYDLRPLILELHKIEADPAGHQRLYMHLSAREGATGRPDEILDELGIAIEDARVERTHLFFKE